MNEQPVRNVAVIGLGQMGGGILQPSYASVDHNWNWTGGGGPP